MQDQNLTSEGPSRKLIFPLMALLAGVLGGVFGIGGGMLISPLLLQVGIDPEVNTVIRDFSTHCFTYLFEREFKMRRKQRKLRLLS